MAGEAQTAFISYSREDSEFALKLAEDLKAAGAAVWLDQLDIAPGQRWARAVQDALNDCPRMLVILSPASVSSTNVDDEVSFALEEGKTVIPVLYRDCKIPFRLRPFQFVDFRSDYDLAMKRFLRTLPAALVPARVAPAPKETVPPASNQDRAEPVIELERGQEQPADQPLAKPEQVISIAGQVAVSRECESGLTTEPEPVEEDEEEEYRQTVDQRPTGEGQTVPSEDKTQPIVSQAHSDPSVDAAPPIEPGIHRATEPAQSEQERARASESAISAASESSAQSDAVPESDRTLQEVPSKPSPKGVSSSAFRTNWKKQASGISTDLFSVTFVPPQSGWAVGSYGVILHTEDGGRTWTKQNSGTEYDLCSVTFVNELSGWAAGKFGTILHTEDGGRSWTRQARGIFGYLCSVTFVNEKSGWAVADDGLVVRTEDGGRSWNKQASMSFDGVSRYCSVTFVNEKSGWVVADDGLVVHSEDGGRSWNKQSSGFDGRLYSTAFLDTQSGWAVGSWGTILHTEDGGRSWNKQARVSFDSFAGMLHSVTFMNPKTGWAVGSDGTIVHTEDGGRNWTQQSSGVGENLLSVMVANVRSGWAVGERGTILHYEE